MAEKLWVAQYMRETESKKRREILEQAIAEEGELPENLLRRRLLEARCPVAEGREIDVFLRGWMNMQYLDRTAQGFLARRRIEKEKQKIFSDWQFALKKEYPEQAEEVFYQEFFNLGRLYIELCKDDGTYRSILLGLGRMKEDKVIAKIARDFYHTGYEVPVRFEMQDELEPFTRGITDAFCEVFDRQKEYLLMLIREKNTQEM